MDQYEYDSNSLVKTFLYESLVSASQFLSVFIELLPIFIIPFIILFVCKWVVRFDEGERKNSHFEIFFFALIGVAAAYINYLSRDSFLKEILPNIILAAVSLSQIAGLSLKGFDPPISNGKSAFSAAAATISFIFSARYIERVFGSNIENI